MEEGKKKRWRPSLTAYRALEKENEELRKSKAGNASKVLRDHIEALESENTSLKRSNELMEKELNKIRNEERSYEKECDELKERIFLLENRGFWARLFNKKV